MPLTYQASFDMWRVQYHSNDILVREGHYVLHRVLVLLSQIEDGTERTILFRYAKHRHRLVCYGWYLS
jgi:hypothetical protein